VGSGSNLSKLPSWAFELLELGRVGRLGFLDRDGAPRVLPVTYALHGDEVWSAVDRKPKRAAGEQLARVRYLRRDPRAAFTVDRYSDDWAELAWVQVLGEVRVVEAGDAGDAIAKLTDKYAPYREQPPPGPLLALRPSRCIYWQAAKD
jgi:PPOX class probable F420-dependent enzyme